VTGWVVCNPTLPGEVWAPFPEDGCRNKTPSLWLGLHLPAACELTLGGWNWELWAQVPQVTWHSQSPPSHRWLKAGQDLHTLRLPGRGPESLTFPNLVQSSVLCLLSQLCNTFQRHSYLDTPILYEVINWGWGTLEQVGTCPAHRLQSLMWQAAAPCTQRREDCKVKAALSGWLILDWPHSAHIYSTNLYPRNSKRLQFIFFSLNGSGPVSWAHELMFGYWATPQVQCWETAPQPCYFQVQPEYWGCFNWNNTSY
jgi:hypothetical protein